MGRHVGVERLVEYGREQRRESVRPDIVGQGEQFFDLPPATLDDAVQQEILGLAVRLAVPDAGDEDRLVLGDRLALVTEPVRPRPHRPGQRDVGESDLLPQLTGCCVVDGLARLDATARGRPVLVEVLVVAAVAEQEHAVELVDEHHPYRLPDRRHPRPYPARGSGQQVASCVARASCSARVTQSPYFALTPTWIFA